MTRVLPSLLLLLAACSTATTTSGGNPNAAPNSAASSANPYYVCHGNKDPKWKRVAVSAVDAHRRHGDRVVTTTQRVNTACTR
ncbi:MAG TPA: hypothetical protein VG940_02730 [Gemmatimonadales bacterium]|nr:hypothetical protein [Gemmatimonadales bacterium]